MNNIIIGVSVYCIACLILFLFFVFRKKYRSTVKNDYEVVREKLTLREEEPKGEEVTDENVNPLIGCIIGALVVVIAGIMTLLGVINQITDVTSQINVSSASAEMLAIVPVFFILGVMTAVISIILTSLRRGGLM